MPWKKEVERYNHTIKSIQPKSNDCNEGSPIRQDMGVSYTSFSSINGIRKKYVVDSVLGIVEDVVDECGSDVCLDATKHHKRRRSVQPEIPDMAEEEKQQNEQDIRASITVQEECGRTYLSAIVIDQNDTANGNRRASVRCHHGSAFSAGYPYDQASDSYIIPCATHIALGYVPIAYYLGMPGTGNWRVRSPLPEVVVNRYLNGVQKSKIAELQQKYPQPRYVIQIMQMAGCET